MLPELSRLCYVGLLIIDKVIKRDPIRGQIKRLLLARILDGTYRPGDRLLELQIARELNTSQGPVREALRELEALRMVECKAYCGTRVRGVNAREMREAYQVRGALEELAAPAAARSLKGNVAGLRVELEALRSAAKTRDLDAYAAHNLSLHRLIVEASGNSVLLRIWESLDFEARARVALERPISLREAAETHQPIIDALNRGDGRLAARLLRAHAESFYTSGQSKPEEPPLNGTVPARSKKRIHPHPTNGRPQRAGGR
jgi:DNA-binding GntR family transcriptional regulator